MMKFLSSLTVAFVKWKDVAWEITIIPACNQGFYWIYSEERYYVQE